MPFVYEPGNKHMHPGNVHSLDNFQQWPFPFLTWGNSDQNQILVHFHRTFHFWHVLWIKKKTKTNQFIWGDRESKQMWVQILSPSEMVTCPIIEPFCFNLKTPPKSRQLLATSRWHLQTQAIIWKKIDECIYVPDTIFLYSDAYLELQCSQLLTG